MPLKLRRKELHGHSYSRTYQSWQMMIVRCERPAHNMYRHYGGRGIQVCDRWRNSFQAFLNDMGERPEQTSLDRIDPNGNYEPSNCRWASAIQQGNNRRNNKRFSYAGRELTLSQWSRATGVPRDRILSRLRRGWDFGTALTSPRNSEKPTCKRGHPFDEANTHYDVRGSRCCRACGAESKRQSRARGYA